MDNINLIGVSTIGADCYLEPSLSASMKIINRFSTKILLLHLHMSVVLIRFLKIGECMHFMDALPILNETHLHTSASISQMEAYEDIILD